MCLYIRRDNFTRRIMNPQQQRQFLGGIENFDRSTLSHVNTDIAPGYYGNPQAIQTNSAGNIIGTDFRATDEFINKNIDNPIKVNKKGNVIKNVSENTFGKAGGTVDNAGTSILGEVGEKVTSWLPDFLREGGEAGAKASGGRVAAAVGGGLVILYGISKLFGGESNRTVQQ